MCVKFVVENDFYISFSIQSMYVRYFDGNKSDMDSNRCAFYYMFNCN